ncbi:helix-turn-helix domain-containing protein [Tetragenococcus muriaticus]|uniref:helix-turn-helix domain-containing protein n=1 Tax=Tetragenococcus muriaticus TaxID=64642 RepID=UPI00040B6213|nr:helix-turn-helix transcriptional regulator [Tetragenococcus muriaticus]GMA46877.1 transcriptional regulator [Tetragenococcus muriaticus]
MKTYERLKQLREEKGLTQNEIAQSLDIDRSVYNKIETNVRPIRENELITIADFFSVSTDYLLGRTSQKYDISDLQKEKDIAKQIENTINQVTNDTDLNFYGRSINYEERKFLETVLKMSLRLSKEEFKN